MGSSPLVSTNRKGHTQVCPFLLVETVGTKSHVQDASEHPDSTPQSREAGWRASCHRVLPQAAEAGFRAPSFPPIEKGTRRCALFYWWKQSGRKAMCKMQVNIPILLRNPAKRDGEHLATECCRKRPRRGSEPPRFHQKGNSRDENPCANGASIGANIYEANDNLKKGRSLNDEFYI